MDDAPRSPGCAAAAGGEARTANARAMKFMAITRRRIESYARGDFREIFSRGDVPGAVIVMEAEDAEAAWRLVESLPLFQRGMMDVEVIPLKPYRGFV